jgi:hypothetical protein
MPLAALGRLVHFLRDLSGPHRPAFRARVVRRVALHCPHDCELVEVDILQGPDAGLRPVLRCSARPECPPSCDHACRALHDAVAGPARALLILPPGEGVPDEVD